MRKTPLGNILVFGKTSIFGLAVDLAVFYLLVQQIPVFAATLIGSVVGMSTTHVLSAKPVFERSTNVATWTFSIIFSVASTLIFSFATDLIVREANLIPIVARLSTVPVSFCVNYLGNKIIFRAGAKT